MKLPELQERLSPETTAIATEAGGGVCRHTNTKENLRYGVKTTPALPSRDSSLKPRPNGSAGSSTPHATDHCANFRCRHYPEGS